MEVVFVRVEFILFWIFVNGVIVFLKFEVELVCIVVIGVVGIWVLCLGFDMGIFVIVVIMFFIVVIVGKNLFFFLLNSL